MAQSTFVDEGENLMAVAPPVRMKVLVSYCSAPEPADVVDGEEPAEAFVDVGAVSVAVLPVEPVVAERAVVPVVEVEVDVEADVDGDVSPPAMADVDRSLDVGLDASSPKESTESETSPT